MNWNQDLIDIYISSVRALDTLAASDEGNWTDDELNYYHKFSATVSLIEELLILKVGVENLPTLKDIFPEDLDSIE
jgi:hypothetical protein